MARTLALASGGKWRCDVELSDRPRPARRWSHRRRAASAAAARACRSASFRRTRSLVHERLRQERRRPHSPCGTRASPSTTSSGALRHERRQAGHRCGMPDDEASARPSVRPPRAARASRGPGAFAASVSSRARPAEAHVGRLHPGGVHPAICVSRSTMRAARRLCAGEARKREDGRDMPLVGGSQRRHLRIVRHVVVAVGQPQAALQQVRQCCDPDRSGPARTNTPNRCSV